MSEKDVKRTKEIKIRLTESEHKALLNCCTKASLASWMRETCLNENERNKAKLLKSIQSYSDSLQGLEII